MQQVQTAARFAPWLKKAASVVVVGSLCVGAFWLGFRNTDQPPNGGLVVDQSALNFGEVWENRDFVWELPIENPTPDHVKILSFSSSCICQKVEPESIVVPANTTAKVRLTLNLTHRERDQSQSNARNFAVQLIPFVDGIKNEQPGWEIKGRVRSAITAKPPSVDFGTSLVRGTPFASRSVNFNTHHLVAGLNVENNQFVTVARERISSNRYELKITPRKDLPAGEFECEVRLEPISKNGEHLPAFSLPVQGIVLEDIQALPSPVIFGMKRLGADATETIVLHSISGKQFRVRRIETGGQDRLCFSRILIFCSLSGTRRR